MNKIAHVFLQKFFKFQTTEICFKEHSRIRLATIYIYIYIHTHAHLDLRVWHLSPWILVLTLQYMQCKYVFIFIPTWAPHKLLELGKRRQSHQCLGEDPKIPYIQSDLRVLQKEKVSYVLFLKVLKCFSNWLDWRKMVICFKLFHSSTAQSFMVDTLNLAEHVQLGMVLCWCLVLRLCLE